MKKPNSLAKLINSGEGRNVFHANGYVTVIQIVLMVLMKTLRYIIAQHLNLVERISLLVLTDGVSTK